MASSLAWCARHNAKLLLPGPGLAQQCEDIVLNFGQVEVDYQPQSKDGAKEGGPIKYGWNIRENVKI